MPNPSLNYWVYKKLPFAVRALFVILLLVFCIKTALFQTHSGLPPQEPMYGSYSGDVIQVGDTLYFGDGSISNELTKSAAKGGSISKRLGIRTINELEHSGKYLYMRHEDRKFAVFDTESDKIVLDADLQMLFAEEKPFDYTMRSVDSAGAYFEIYCAEGVRICFVSSQGQPQVLRNFPDGKSIDLLKANEEIVLYNLKEKDEVTGEWNDVGMYSWNQKTGEERLLSRSPVYPSIRHGGSINEIWNGQYLTAETSLRELRIIPLDGSKEEIKEIPAADYYCFADDMIYGVNDSYAVRYNLKSGESESVEVEGKRFEGGLNIFEGNLIMSFDLNSPVLAKKMFIMPLDELTWQPLDKEFF